MLKLKVQDFYCKMQLQYGNIIYNMIKINGCMLEYYGQKLQNINKAYKNYDIFKIVHAQFIIAFKLHYLLFQMQTQFDNSDIFIIYSNTITYSRFIDFFQKNRMKAQNQNLRKITSDLPNFQIIKKIGEGLTSEVYLAESLKYGKVSIKAISHKFYNSQMGSLLIDNQISILETLAHTNILKFNQTIKVKNSVYLITQYCEGQNLETLIHKKQNLTPKKSLEILSQIVKGCLYLKQKNIIHRDLKPSNIFFKNEKPIIADFGFAAHLNNQKLLKLNAGSPLYMPHESLSVKKFSTKSDIFALGVILFEMLTGKTPWQAGSQQQLKNKLKVAPYIGRQTNSQIRQLLVNCLAFEPSNRPTLQNLSRQIDNIIQFEFNKNYSLKQKNKNIQLQKGQKFYKSISFKQNHPQRQKKQQKTNKQNKQINIVHKNYKQQKSLSLLVKSKNVKQVENAKFKNQYNFLQVINANDFSFLPVSLINKFDCILNQYKKILGQISSVSGQKKQYQENDKLIAQIKNCQTELQLCKTIESFIRRLLRLTKNYKQYKHCLINLEGLCKRVQNVII